MTRFTICMLLLVFCFLGTTTRGLEKLKTEAIVFEGTVLRFAPEPAWVSGNTAVYRLVKYRVERVCGGRYADAEIVVDHLILNGKELEGIKVGDKVCVSVDKTNKIFARYNEKGIREPSDVVKVFYIGDNVSPAKKPPCEC